MLFIVLNHAGDVMSANIVMEMARKEGLNVKQVLTHEDISTGAQENLDERRGLAGCLLVYKVAGAAAEQGRSLDECVAIAERMDRQHGHAGRGRLGRDASLHRRSDRRGARGRDGGRHGPARRERRRHLRR